ncbi:MAG: hypothetical protein AAF911_12125 [Planctomycetota bacterium]
MTRTLGPVCLLLALLLGTGCRSGSVVPDGWGIDPAAAATPAEAWQAEAQAQRDDAPRLQVFIHYAHTHGSHVAVRVTTPDQPAVFWDPGGAYGMTKPAYGRKHDIILDAPPDLPTWWSYRQKWLNEPFLYVFEWDLEAPQARAMRHALLDGATHGRSAEEFQTVRTPGLCVIAVSDFLRTYGPPHISPKLRSNFWPNTLALQLWRQQPTRVLRYEGEADATPVVLAPIAQLEDAITVEHAIVPSSAGNSAEARSRRSRDSSGL